MSELHVYHHELRHNEYAEFYLKYEVDKVIADLEEAHKKEDEQLLMDIEEIKDAQQWRKVEDELPVGMYPVLIYVKVNGRRYITTGHYNSSKNTWYEHVNYGEVKVTHFMDFPKPPKEVK